MITSLETQAPVSPAPPPSRSPQVLRRLQVVTAVAVLLAGVVSVWVMAALHQDLSAVSNVTQQHARLGLAQDALTRATGLAAQDVLLGDLAPKTIAEAVTEEVATANGLLIEVAKDRPDDTARVRELGEGVLRLSASLNLAIGASQADGAKIMQTANQQLDDQLAAIDAVQDQLATEAAGEPWGLASPLAVGLCVAMLLIVLGASWIVARLSHRVINLGLAGAGIAIVIVLVLVASAQGTADRVSEETRKAHYSRVAEGTTAMRQLDAAERVLTMSVLTHQWDAKAKDAYTKAVKKLTSERTWLPSTEKFESGGKAITTLMSNGQWAQAADAVLSKEDRSFGAAADELRETAVARVETWAGSAPDKASGAGVQLVALIVSAIVLALGGAALAVLGLSWRLEEYR